MCVCQNWTFQVENLLKKKNISLLFSSCSGWSRDLRPRKEAEWNVNWDVIYWWRDLDWDMGLRISMNSETLWVPRSARIAWKLREISYLYTHNWVIVYEIISESKLVLTVTKKLMWIWMFQILLVCWCQMQHGCRALKRKGWLFCWNSCHEEMAETILCHSCTTYIHACYWPSLVKRVL